MALAFERSTRSSGTFSENEDIFSFSGAGLAGNDCSDRRGRAVNSLLLCSKQDRDRRRSDEKYYRGHSHDSLPFIRDDPQGRASRIGWVGHEAVFDLFIWGVGNLVSIPMARRGEQSVIRAVKPQRIGAGHASSPYLPETIS